MIHSLQKIAQSVGVSRGAVSHVLNGRGHKVSLQTRRRIQASLEKSGYHPNALVRALKSKRTRTLGLVVSSARVSLFSDLIDAVEAESRKNGFQCFLCQSHNSTETLAEEVRLLQEYRVDGLIVSPVNSFEQPDLYRRLWKEKVPFVLVDHEVDGVKAPCVTGDDFQMGKLATEHLLEFGHTRIVCIRGYWQSFNARLRFEGYRQALREGNIPFDESLALGGGFEMNTGKEAVHVLMEKKVEFTGIVASTDLAAIGAMQALQEGGVRIPGEVSVVGCGNLDGGLLVAPRLTTVDQQVHENGRRAVRLLLELLEKEPARRKALKIQISPTLIARESAAAVKK